MTWGRLAYSGLTVGHSPEKYVPQDFFMNHFNIELPSRFQDSRSGDVLAADDRAPASVGKVRAGRAAWPFLVGGNRSANGGESSAALAPEHSFSS